MPDVLLAEAISVELIAQEPLQAIEFYQPLEVEQILLPDNANCLAVRAFLHMCGINFKVNPQKNAEYMSPTGRVPFIKCGERLISEFENIVTFMGIKGISLSQCLKSDEKADMRAYMSLVNNVFLNAELYICWCDKETYKNTQKRHGGVYPWPLNHLLNWQKQRQVIKKLNVFGWYNKTLDQVCKDVEDCCAALSDRLEGKSFFYGNEGPNELDALVFGHVFTMITTSLPDDRLANIVNGYPNLVNLCKRIDKRYFQGSNGRNDTD